MGYSTTLSANNLKDRKKSKRITFTVYAILIALLFIPITQEIKEQTEDYAEIMVDFRDFKAASAMSAAAAGEEKAEEEVVKPVEAPTPKPDPAPEAVKTPVQSSVVEEKPAPVKATTKPKVEKTPVKKTPKPVTKPTKKPVKKTPAKTTGNKGAGTVATQGTGKKGNATTDGKAEAGKQGMDFEGDALFARKVIRRAEIKHLSQKEGTIVVNLCVNQDGGVVYTEFNKKDSNIYDSRLTADALKATRKYRFEPDYTAPKKQCGKLTYIIELN